MTEPAAAAGIAGAERIAAAFGDHGKRAALMPYLMGGYPDLAGSRAVGEACADAGADLVELGVPFSDPLADGPVIHAAATAALAAGATVDGVLEVCEALAGRLPVVLMVYSNIVLRHGDGGFAARAADAGAAGLIVPDLPYDEAGRLRESCDGAGIALVPLTAPNTDPERLAGLAAAARGFVYAVTARWDDRRTRRAAAAAAPRRSSGRRRWRTCPSRPGSASRPRTRSARPARSPTG